MRLNVNKMSTIRRDSFWNIHFGLRGCENKISLEFLEPHNGACLKSYQRMEQKLVNEFYANVFICCNFLNNKKIIFKILFSE